MHFDAFEDYRKEIRTFARADHHDMVTANCQKKGSDKLNFCQITLGPFLGDDALMRLQSIDTSSHNLFNITKQNPRAT